MNIKPFHSKWISNNSVDEHLKSQRLKCKQKKDEIYKPFTGEFTEI